MQHLQSEKFLAKLLGFGSAFTTIFLISGSVTDPVNTPKLFVIGIFGTASAFILFATELRKRLLNFKPAVTLLVLFYTAMLFSTLKSEAPTDQLIYGSYGRNNGFLAYFFLGLIFVSTFALQSQHSFSVISKSLYSAGLVNIAYCLWVLLFGDFIGWNNPYGNILGTFGNPNFIGAFLGIIFSITVAMLLAKNVSKKFKYLLLLLLPICLFEIIKSQAIQGRVVAAFGTALIFFLYIRSRFNRFVLAIYSTGVVIVGGFALAGALQIGPLTEFIYKTSVSLRGQYWLAGWKTGLSHPFSGVGMDTFGDWYRRTRDPHALVLPGVDTVVNTAHNVPLDIFAFGGWPLVVTYLMILILAGWVAIKIIWSQKVYDLTFAILFSSWAGYQLQSIISINQIGLAVWGWLLSGLLIAYGRTIISAHEMLTGNPERTKQKFKSQGSFDPKIPIFGLFGSLLGLCLALPPLTADARWRDAQVSRSLQKLEQSMDDGYFNPQNSMKYMTNVQILEDSQLFDLSHKYALQGVKWNPNSYELWKVLYLIRNSTKEEKALAVKNMKRLDPLNPDVTAR